MHWLENLQAKTQKEKEKIILITAGAVLVLLIVLWAIIGNLHSNSQANTSLFQTIGNGIKQLKEQKIK